MRKLNMHLGPIPPFDTRTVVEKRYILNTFHRPFSGFLGGIHTGGYWIERLRDEWSSSFGVKYSIPCNSATSGLLAACIAVGIGPGDEVWAPVYTMSATAACAKILGAKVKFIDVDERIFALDTTKAPGGSKPKAIIVTNLFGHPAYISEIRAWCNTNNVWMIEDAAQSPFAKTMGGKLAGTVGHIGVFSFNVHKHLQCGEGGIIVTNDIELANKINDAVNHGELGHGTVGLNLRMTEPIAAMAVAQLGKAHWIIEGRRELAHEMTQMVKGISGIEPPYEAFGYSHVYYIWAAKLWPWKRAKFIKILQDHGFPMNEGYSPLLSRVFNDDGKYPIAEELEDKKLITFDICSYSPTRRQKKMMKDIIGMAADQQR